MSAIGHLIYKVSFMIIVVIMTSVVWAAAFVYDGSSFRHVKQVIFASPYATLPHYKVDKKRFGRSGDNAANLLLAAAKRTLTNLSDLYKFPHGQKLLQANGICFTGKWIIDSQSPFTGQFSHLTQSLAIVRASVSLSGTRQQDRRAFAIAIKLFPTTDPDAIVKTLNIFTMHSMGGVKSKHILDLVVDNEPLLGGLPGLGDWATAYRLLADLERADGLISYNKPSVRYRPVTHLAEYGHSSTVVAPRWLRLRPVATLPRINRQDFRDELRIEHYPRGQLQWDIDVAPDSDSHNKSTAQWTTIGKLILTDSVTSAACDNRLHFTHPPLR